MNTERNPGACVLADIPALSHDLTVKLVRAALEGARDSRRRNGLPHWVVLDEVHYSLHRKGVETAPPRRPRHELACNARGMWGDRAPRVGQIHHHGTMVAR